MDIWTGIMLNKKKPPQVSKFFCLIIKPSLGCSADQWLHEECIKAFNKLFKSPSCPYLLALQHTSKPLQSNTRSYRLWKRCIMKISRWQCSSDLTSYTSHHIQNYTSYSKLSGLYIMIRTSYSELYMINDKLRLYSAHHTNFSSISLRLHFTSI